MAKLEELRAKHPDITYKSAKYELNPTGLLMTFEFELSNGPIFRPTNLIKGVTQTDLDQLDPAMIQDMVFQIGLVELLSYWKATCSPMIVVQAGDLTPDQLIFWQNLLVKGMGEYFYVNQIDFTQPNLVTWQVDSHSVEPVQNETQPEPNEQMPTPQSYLIPVGGGKDSVVSVELLKRYAEINPEVKLATLVVNPTPAARQIVQLSQLTSFEVERKLDPQLLALNQQGYLNGHTPFSALLAFISILVAYICRYQAVAVANEQSANEESLQFLGHPINHQYSKSFEFEQGLQKYIAKYVADYSFRTRRPGNVAFMTFLSSPLTPIELSDTNGKPKVLQEKSATYLHDVSVPSDESGASMPFYFSILRPLTELKIAQLFTTLTQAQPEYRTAFISCNRGGREGKWCGHCAKCLFAYLILAPFLGLDQVQSIFGRDLLTDAQLEPILAALIGLTDQKPLDCVGLTDESRTALYLIWQKYQKTGATLPVLVSRFETTLTTDQTLPTLADQLLNIWYQPDAIPSDLARWLKPQVEKLKYAS